MKPYNHILLEDTIVALATPEGVSAIGVIRLSGKKALKIASEVFSGKDLTKQEPNTLHYGALKDGENIIDEVVIGIFKAPRSYTGEDIAEISCHGSPFIHRKVLELLIEKGARMARPGEFTMRAFLNGKMDLSQAEAVADLILASSESAHSTAMQQIRGGFSGEIKKLRDELVHFASMVELELDFSEEDVEFANRDQLVELVNQIRTVLGSLIRSYRLGNVIKEGVTTVIAGRPNAGKSTLLNALLNEERAIVSEIPGTTRDTIEEIINLEGILFRLVDTAGIRDAAGKIEAMGVERTLEKIRQSAIVIYLYDVNELSEDELEDDVRKLEQGVPIIVVGNKIDTGNGQKNGDDIVYLSSKTLENIDGLKARLTEKLFSEGLNLEGAVVTNIRHFEALNKADKAMEEVLTGLNSSLSGELLALDIRRSLDALGEITGAITDEDLLGNIFSKFCIGK